MAQTNVLVVEDESIVSKDIQHSLKKLGYNVVGAASTGDQAVKLAIETLPDIILMDIMLKGEMNGIEAATQIRTETNTDGLEVLDEIVSSKVRRAIECGVLDNVRFAQLIVGFQNRSGVYDKPELRALLGLCVLADVISDPVRERSDLDVIVNWKRSGWRRRSALRAGE